MWARTPRRGQGPLHGRAHELPDRRRGSGANPSRNRQPAARVQRRPGVRADDRQTAVVVHVVEAELGAVQLLGEITERDPPLARVVRFAVRTARRDEEVRIRRSEGGEGTGDGRGAEDGEGVALHGEAHVAQVQVGERDHRLLRARAGVVGDREVAAHRIDLGRLPVELVEPLHGQEVGRRHRQRHQPDREERLAELRAREPQLAHVEGVYGVDAVRDEGALAPVEDVLSEPDVDGRVAGVERGGDVGVEHLEVPAHPILRRVAQGGAFPPPVLVLVVDETGGPEERAEAADADVEVGRELRCVADHAAVVVEVAVVAVGVVRELGVALRDAEGHAVRDRGIEAPLEVAVPELDRLRRPRVQEPAQGERARRQRDCAEREACERRRSKRRTVRRPPYALRSVEPRRAGLRNVPHGVPSGPIVVARSWCRGESPRHFVERTRCLERCRKIEPLVMPD